jgi:hypothetical protein
MEVVDTNGKLIRTLSPTNHAGLNRVWWNLHYDPMKTVALRTTPPGNSHIWEEKRFAGKDTRPIFYYGIGGESTDGPLVAPGTYTIKLNADGQTTTQKISVLRDPTTTASDQDIVESSAFSYKIYQDANESAQLINQIEWTRKQLDETKQLFQQNRADKVMIDAGSKLDGQLLELENKLMHPTIAEGDAKSFRGPLGLYLKFIWLGAEAGNGAGDVSGNSDFKPTQSEVEVFNLLDKQLQNVKTALDDLNQHAVPAFNRNLQQSGMGRIITANAK